MKKEKGITLIALVVTIILLIILAGVSLVVLFGDNGIITKAGETKEMQKIAELTEKLELEKGPVALDHLGEVLIADYLEYIQGKNIIQEKDIEHLNEFQAYLTLEEKYVFLAEEMDNRDVKITYMGEPGELPPRIAKLEVTSTTKSITVKVSGVRLENAIYQYFIKAEKNAEYGAPIVEQPETTYTFNNLNQNHIYYIQVEAHTEHGNSKKETNITTGTITALDSNNTTFTTTPSGWTNGSVKTKIATTVKGYTLQYSKDLTNWSNYTAEVASNKNETIYARLTDGKNIGNYTSTQIKNIDTTVPEAATIALSGAGTVASNPTVKAKVTHTDKQSGVEVTKCRWVFNTKAGTIGNSESSYTGGAFSSNGQELTLPMSGQATYYLHILTVDKAGNKKETISKPIKVVANTHTHTGSSSTGGGCYTTPVYHQHTGSSSTGGGCYTTPVYHQHTGSVSTGGGCYTKVIYHSHTGNSSTNGGCYTLPVYHAHSSSCYQTGTCHVSIHLTHASRNDHWDEHIDSWEDHGSCGQARHYINPKHFVGDPCHCGDGYDHTYSKLVCSKANTIESYAISCGKTAGTTVEGYQVNCGKVAGSTVERYNVGCGKTAGSSIDSYNLGCGITAGQIVSYSISY